MDTRDPMELVKVFNPDSEDYQTTYDILGDNTPVDYYLPSHEVREFPRCVVENIEKNLADRLVRKRGTDGSNYEIEFNRALEKIRV